MAVAAGLSRRRVVRLRRININRNTNRNKTLLKGVHSVVSDDQMNELMTK